MTQKIQFTKMHGLGNDYIYVNTMKYSIADPEQVSIKWSAPHTGIGSDGLVLIGDSKIADFSMRIFNADGSEAMMCGNASRCIGKYLYDKKITNKTEIALETLSGIKHLKLNIVNDEVSTVSVDMGIPKPELITVNGEQTTMIAQEIIANGQTFTATAVSMGNPHLVIFIDDIEKIDLPVVGPILENHPLFPGRINVEFVQKLSDDKVRMRVWERGSGITMACGTGACGTAVAGAMIGKINREAEVIMDGGSLSIKWDEESDRVYMTGTATTVFEGEIEL